MASSSLFRPKLLLYLIFVPLLFALLGSWQFRRVSTPVEAPGQHAPVVFHSGEIVPEPPQLFREASPEALQRLRLLALAAIVTGLAATYAGGIGLYVLRRAAIRAMASQEVLYQGLRAGLKRISPLIGASAFLLALSMACAFAYELMDIAARTAWGEQNQDRLLLTAGGAALLLLLAALRIAGKASAVSRTLLSPAPLHLHGRLVDEAEAPRVWALAREAAQKADAPLPEALVLCREANFCATALPVSLKSANRDASMQIPGGGLVLALPLPCLAFLPEEEAAALIGRELGAFKGEDARYPRDIVPLRLGAEEGLYRLEKRMTTREAGFFAFLDRPALLLGECCLRAFAPADQRWGREHQALADNAGEAVAGKEGLALALERLAWLSPAVAAALDACDPHDVDEDEDLDCLRRRVRDHAGQPPARESGLLARLGLEEAGRGAGGASDPDDPSMPLAQSSLAAETRCSGGAVREATLADLPDEDPEHLALLHEIAAKGEDTRLFYEHAMGSMLACLGMSLLLCITAALIAGAHMSVALACFAGSAVLLWLTVQLVDRMKKPFVTFTKDGFQVADMQENVAPWRIRRHERPKAGARRPEIPWTAVTDVINGMAGGMHVLTIRLAEGYEPPAFTHDRRARYNPAARALTLRVLGFRKPDSLQTFGEALLDHWRGGVARRELRGLEKSR